MSDSYISLDLRRLIAARASRRCEYCLIHESDTFMGCQVDHILSEKHGGQTTAENLAFACTFCNRSKGSDIATLDEQGQLTRLFHPRLDSWNDHFVFQEARIEPLTGIGFGTARLLGFNTDERIEERLAMTKPL